jgi:cell wall-associated NlpC family hydrolase
MKSKSYVFQCLMILNIFLACSCSYSKKLVKSDSYSLYSQKLGVKLTGDENPELLKKLIEWKGVPYKYGGSSKNGTDCSGFVGSVYKEVYGKQLKRTSVDMVDNVRFVSKKELKAGDILFFKINSRKISHVGIYIADNKFIHASTKNGVVVSDLNQKYYADSFYKGGRVR